VLLIGGDTVEESRVLDVARRALHAAALDDLSATTVDDRSIAAHVIDDVPLPRAGSKAGLPAGLITADLRVQAETESARLQMVRELARTGGPPFAQSHHRPFAARRRRRQAPPAIWALWVEFTDSDGQLVWETLAGVAGNCGRSARVSATEVRALVDLSWARVRECVENDHLQNAQWLDSIRAVASLALKREAAVANGIARRHARLAAHLVQGALFDRRAERHAAAQRDLAEHALARCRERQAALERLRRTTVIFRPAFALVPW